MKVKTWTCPACEGEVVTRPAWLRWPFLRANYLEHGGRRRCVSCYRYDLRRRKRSVAHASALEATR